MGIDKAQTDVFARIDSGVVPVKGQRVNLLFKKFDDPEIGSVGPCMFSDEPLRRKEYAAYYQHVRNFGERAQSTKF